MYRSYLKSYRPSGSPFLQGAASIGEGLASIGRAMASVLDISGRSSRSYQVSLPKVLRTLEDDRKAMAADWEAVGRDMHQALGTSPVPRKKKRLKRR